MFSRRPLKSEEHRWHRSTLEARTGPAVDARQVAISNISSSRQLDTSARREKGYYQRELHLAKWFGTGWFSQEGTIAMVAVSGICLTHAAGGLYTGLASLGREFPPQVCRGASKKKTKTSCVISLLGERIKWEVFC